MELGPGPLGLLQLGSFRSSLGLQVFLLLTEPLSASGLVLHIGNPFVPNVYLGMLLRGAWLASLLDFLFFDTYYSKMSISDAFLKPEISGLDMSHLS